ncbi:hypothetical protein MANES_05G128400v8 [Manihot esculenta]|uniref:Uncharacterized protein n=1 Tax=Manihot esculenta TaxID=3983 RepID=A0ACB7HQS4_MANES|nr:hypothetical protein MANES_05G128400v8 [Manihot esculenta]
MSFYFLFFNFNFNNSSRKRTYHRKSTRIAPPSQAPRPQGLKAKSKTLCFICSWCCGVFNLKMTEGGGSSVSRRQRRLKRDSEDQCQNLKQKCLKMDNPADDAQKNGTDTNNGLLPGTSGEEKCIMIEGYKYFFGEKGLLLRAEPMDKADLEKLENTEEKRALEKKMAREWKRIAKAAIAYHNHQEMLAPCRVVYIVVLSFVILLVDFVLAVNLPSDLTSMGEFLLIVDKYFLKVDGLSRVVDFV